MKLADLHLDWQKWFDRWEAQQDCYVPHRLYRFDLMLRWADLPRQGQVRILDLGCGPGSTSLRALEHHPNARVVAVDVDPVLLAMGRHVTANRAAGRIEFLEADIRQADWWAAYDASFDLALSANALHWLGPESLTGAYRGVQRALKPGGWFMNSDHVASDDPATQARYRQMLEGWRKAALGKSGAYDWDSFWDSLGRELGLDLRQLRNVAEYWEGSDDGLPRQFHLAALRECGFEQVQCHWQHLGEAVVGARKPAGP